MTGFGIPPLVALRRGEMFLWSGAPNWRSVARRVLHVWAVAGYFALLTLADLVQARLQGEGGAAALQAGLPGFLTGVATLLILTALAWGVARTTLYTITTQRIVLQFGLALPARLELPLERIASASVRVRDDHTGDIALRLFPGEHVAFLKLWPHARPWHWVRPEPMLRGVPQAARVAAPLCRALSAARDARSAAEVIEGQRSGARRG
jgi:hypothetical protein